MKIEGLTESDAMYWNQKGSKRRRQRRTRNENNRCRRSKIGKNNELTFFLEKHGKVGTLKIP